MQALSLGNTQTDELARLYWYLEDTFAPTMNGTSVIDGILAKVTPFEPEPVDP
jgi:hypothetical protein